MWTLRRAANPLMNHGYRVGSSRTCCVKSDIVSNDLEDRVGACKPIRFISERLLPLKRSHNTPSIYAKFSPGSRSFSSQAGERSSGEQDGFIELEVPASADIIEESNTGEENVNELISEPELSDDDLAEGSHNDLELFDTETGTNEKKPQKKNASSQLFKVIMAAPGQSVQGALDKWVEEGNNLGRAEVSLAFLNLRKRRMYGRALQIFEWLEAKRQLDFVEQDYASRLDLIAKVRGLQKAEKYIEKIPESFRGEVVYRTFLANCVATLNVKKAEEVFNKMKDLEFTITTFACNQLLLLYKKIDRKKIADVLLLMEKENIKPSLFTYKHLIDTKGQSNDITGVEQLVETMEAEGIKPDIDTQAVLARRYISMGFKGKADAVLKEMEGGNLEENRGACRALLPLYAALGKADEVGRVWKVCESNPRLHECMAAIEAWGKLGKIEEAEAVFDRMFKTWKGLSARHFSALLKVYANHKLLAKGKDLLKRMGDSGFRIDPLTVDSLVKLYVEAGEVEKADLILLKAAQQNRIKPMFITFMAVMDQYSKRGDIHNAEKIFHRMRQSGYVSRMRQYEALLLAYINAKAPAYGFRERMKVDNMFPNKNFAAQLVQVDAFRKTTISDLID
ncbi:hypothetical protein HHK36_019673 [Tetracentron sinense]|uniref:PROP1-like PPR domain-containing protein n=1 Tax=Tetracentron sinense TaxID=13715 RepID=A0A834Z0B4_TETSI|nr:hypothetical protein HHK36_019673 [Tetracentron sinense]